jgi:hypothetical protein
MSIECTHRHGNVQQGNKLLLQYPSVLLALDIAAAGGTIEKPTITRMQIVDSSNSALSTQIKRTNQEQD